MERKNFVNMMLAGGSVLLASPLIFSCGSDSDDDINDGMNNGGSNPMVVDLNNSAYASLGTVGGFVYFGNIIIIRTGDSQYIALSKICTHEACTVSYNNSSSRIECPCHGSAFSTGGAVLNGPAPSPLKTYNVTLNGSKLTIS